MQCKKETKNCLFLSLTFCNTCVMLVSVVMTVWNFVDIPSNYGLTDAGDNHTVLEVGYDNLTVTKPYMIFRVQSFYTWHFILSGSGTLEVRGKSYHVEAGEMFFIPPNAEMRYYPKPHDPWDYVWFALNGESAEQYRKRIGFSDEVFTLKNNYSDITNEILRKLFESLKVKADNDFGILSAFYKILEICVSDVSPHSIRSIKEAVDYRCLSPLFDIESLCRNVGISHAHLLRLFKKEYGMTLIGYVKKRRLEYACELLKTTELSVAAVASSCGFSDELHFMKCFKKEYGTTALQYRKSNIGFVRGADKQ